MDAFYLYVSIYKSPAAKYANVDSTSAVLPKQNTRSRHESGETQIASFYYDIAFVHLGGSSESKHLPFTILCTTGSKEQRVESFNLN